MTGNEKSPIKEENNTNSNINTIQLKKNENKIMNLFEKIGKYVYLNLNKDIEISKKQFFTLFLILLCSMSMVACNIYLTFDTGGIKWANLPILLCFGIGFFLGLIGGGLILDKIKGKKFSALFIVMFISIILNILQVLILRKNYELQGLLFFTSSFLTGFNFVIFIIFFLDFTTILERGRIFSFLMIAIALGILIFILIVIANDFFLVFPSLILGVSIFYFYEYRENEGSYRLQLTKESPREVKITILRHVLMFAIIGFTIGLIVPYEQISSLNIVDFSNIKLLIVGFIAVSFIIITVLIIGTIFDFFGRKASLTTIILIVAISNFIRIFDVTFEYFDIATILIAVLAVIMAIPLIMNEISLKKIGQIIGITYTITLIFIAIGYVIHWIILQNPALMTPQDVHMAELYLIGIISFSLIIILVILSNTKEFVSFKEQNWPENLLHLYVIHESGLLLYERIFSTLEENLTDSDLISGGFIGLITMLEEITKESQHLRIIDHGGKKILFGYSQNKSLIFALVLLDDLRILRHKLDYFISDIDELYPLGKELLGVDVGLWKKRFDPLLDKHFKRKYLEMIPDYLLTNLRNIAKITKIKKKPWY